MTADLLREAAAAIREDYSSEETDDGENDPFMYAVADLLDALALDREMDPYLTKHFDEPAVLAARAYLGRDQ